ncbi:MAG: SUMF1/EgtB/PvdO family nonheme iron enzyme [Spirochaetaceae bacterium]|nr:SUMF1/EgtB/PvdO family nonheme iron enzyme [Spirochaetaceae bacterium]
MAEMTTCPKCKNTVPTENFCQECNFPLTDEGKIAKSARETEEEKKERERIEKQNHEAAERKRKHELDKLEEVNRHKEAMAAQKADEERKKREQEQKHELEKQEIDRRHEREKLAEENRHKETMAVHEKRKKLLFLLTLIFLCVIGASIAIGLGIAKKRYDNLPYLNHSNYQIWKNPVSAKEYRYFLSETNYESKASSLQNYVKHVTDEKMELVGFADHASLEDNSPVVYVSFMDAIEYCNFKSNDEGLKEYYTIQDDEKIIIDEQANGYRLPTAEEWTDSAKKFKELRDDKISEWCFDAYNDSEELRIIKKYQKGTKAPAEYQSYSDAAYGVDTIGFRVIRSQE